MAAIDLSAQPVGWFTRRFTVDGDLLQEVVLPSWVKCVRVTSATNAARVTHDGTDGAALGSHYVDVFADNTLPIFKPRLRMSTPEERQVASEPWHIFVTAASSTEISIDPIEEY